MYERSLTKDGHVELSLKAKYDPRKVREEALCPHACEDLSQGGNQYAQWANGDTVDNVVFCRKGIPNLVPKLLALQQTFV